MSPSSLAWRPRLQRLLHIPANGRFMVAAVLVGLAAGLALVAFRRLIEAPRWLLLHLLGADFLTAHALALLVGVPALGGLVAGLLVWWLARRDQSQGTATVMEAVAYRGGRVPARAMLAKAFSAALLIGSGGSAGPEDPSVQLGAVLGSLLSRVLKWSEARARMLTAAGVAGAVAAAFNAPIAGVFFALEVILGEFSAASMAPVVLAAVAASVVGRAFLGAQPAFAAPPLELHHPWAELPLCLLLGLVAAVVGVLLVRLVLAMEARCAALTLPRAVIAALGGALVGLLALAGVWGGGLDAHQQYVTGVGYEVIGDLLRGHDQPWWLLPAKLAATVITLGTARVGGTFAPALVLGALVGGLFGGEVQALFHGSASGPAVWALVGMGAVLTAVIRAPITCVLLLFEVTGDYALILPVMTCVVASNLLAHQLLPESIYTERLRRRGIRLSQGQDVSLLAAHTVQEAMVPDPATVADDLPVGELEDHLTRGRHSCLPVLDAAQHLVGVVALSDLERAVASGVAPSAPVSRIATRTVRLAFSTQSLHEALATMNHADLERLPVVAHDEPTRLVGMLYRQDVVHLYQLAALRRTEIAYARQQAEAASRGGGHVLELELPPAAATVGHLVRDLRLPEQCIISGLLRGEAVLIPRGNTVLQAGDRLTLMVAPRDAARVREYLLTGAGGLAGPRYHEVTVAPGSPADGTLVAFLGLPPGVLIVALRRAERAETVHGQTTLLAGDALTIVADAALWPQIAPRFGTAPAPPE